MTKPVSKIREWVLLRGLSREHRHWGEFLQQLQQTFPEYHFYCIDLPGSGDSYQAASPRTVSGIRHFVEQQWVKQGISGSLGVIGLSLGGMVALDWMHHNRDIAAVVVINSSANNFPLHWRLRPPALWGGVRALLTCDVEQRERMILQLGSRCHADDENTIAEWTAIQHDRPVTRTTIFNQLLAAARFSLPTNPYCAPGLVLSSAGDGMVSNHCSEAIACHFDWPLSRNVIAGHDLPLDDPAWTVDQIRQWLSGFELAL